MSSGDVEIKLNGKFETLRPSLGAARRVNAAYGDFSKAVNRIQAADLEAYIAVVAAGLGKKTADVENDVYLTGLPALGADVIKFVNILANGGKPFEPDAGETASGEG